MYSSPSARASPADSAAMPPIPRALANSFGISGNSIVPSTIEWLAKICSISVDPARGIPMMKIGSVRRRRGHRVRRKNSGV